MPSNEANQTQESFSLDMRKLRRKKKNIRILKRFLAALAVLLLIFCIYISRSLWLPGLEGILEKNYWTPADTSETDEAADEGFPIDISKKVNTLISPMEDCLAIYSDTYLTTVDSDGREIQSVYLPYGTPILQTVSKRAVLYDMGGYNFSVISKKNEVFSKKMDNQILFAAIGTKGNVAVITSTDKFPSYLTVYDRNGNEIYHWADGNYITSVALSPTGNGCLVSSTYASKGSIRSVITELDFSKSEVGAKTRPIETLALSTSYTTSGGFWAIGDNALYRFNKDCEQEFIYSYSYDLSGYAVSGDICALEFGSIDGKFSYLTVTCANGDNSTDEQAFDDIINHIEINGDNVLANTSTRLYLLNKMGDRLESMKLRSEYVTFALSGNEAYMMSHRSIDKVALDWEGYGEENG